jgi:hypothetical protein
MSKEEGEKERHKRLERFFQHVLVDDPLSLVIRGHIYIESALIKLMEQGVPRPEAIDFARLNFPTKINLAVALGLLSEEEKPGYLALNKLRNKLAHDVEIEVGSDDEDALLRALNEAELGDALKYADKLPTRLTGIVFYLLLRLDVLRNREVEKKGQQATVKRTLDELMKTVPELLRR